MQRQLDVLRAGDWAGQGANAFYQEMDHLVLPTLRRLAQALETAQQSTQQINQIMQQAEAEAARWLRGEGSGGSVGGPDAAEAAGLAGDAGRAGPVAAGPAFIPNVRPPNLRAMRQAQARRTAAAQNAAVDKLLSIFDPQVRALVKNSPTLRAQMLVLQQKGYMFQTGTNSQTVKPFITIEPGATAAETVNMIAHETGHAVNFDTEVKRIVETPTMTRDEYVRLNAANNLRNEAAAQLNALQVRAELLSVRAGDIGVPGTQDAAFARVYNDFAAGRITRDQALDRMGPLMGNEVRSGSNPPQTYRDHVIDFYQKDWDTYIAPARRRQP
jgi:WXG100 family type VII secretion target